MCGIAGVVSRRRLSADETPIAAMLRSLRHRGPDDWGTVEILSPTGEPRGAMGQTRLSIIDLSGAGRQPMTTEDGELILTCNGEIYNYRELRDELSSRHRFGSRSDSEVILHLFEEHGLAALDRLEGMFAFALWDGKEGRLLLVRDRFGVKPLYYRHLPDGLAFASELKALVDLPGVSNEIDRNALRNYLSYMYVPDPDTIFEGVRKLAPASVLEMDASGDVRVWEYWTLEQRPDVRDQHRVEEELWALWEDVVRSEMVADVPVGIFLSGGLDSGALAAAARKQGPLSAFTVGFEEASYDESDAAGDIAAALGISHSSRTVTIDDLGLLERVTAAFDEPFGNASTIANLRLAEFARESVKVCLSGTGGDEVLGGYYHHLALKVAARIPGGLRAVGGMVGPLIPADMGRPNLLRRVRRFSEGLSQPQFRRHFGYMSGQHFADEHVEKAFCPEEWDRMRWCDPARVLEARYETSPFSHPVHTAMYADLLTYLPGDILTLTDRASMAHSLEVRVPFLNRRFVEYLFRQPADWKIQGFETKALWRRVVRKHLPRAIVGARKKGFGVPVSTWFKLNPPRIMLELMHDNPFLDPEGVNDLLAEHRSGAQDHGPRLWALVVFSAWLDRYGSCTPRAR